MQDRRTFIPGCFQWCSLILHDTLRYLFHVPWCSTTQGCSMYSKSQMPKSFQVKSERMLSQCHIITNIPQWRVLIPFSANVRLQSEIVCFIWPSIRSHLRKLLLESFNFPSSALWFLLQILMNTGMAKDNDKGNRKANHMNHHEPIQAVALTHVKDLERPRKGHAHG